jgi:hypothetical protein
MGHTHESDLIRSTSLIFFENWEQSGGLNTADKKVVLKSRQKQTAA